MAAKKAKKPAKAMKKPVVKAKVVKKAKKPATKAKAVKAMAAAPAPKKAAPIVPPKKPTLVSPKNGGTKQYNQSELFDCLQGFCGFPNRKTAKEFYGGFTGMVQSALKNGYKLVLPGLGKMQVRRTKARKGINPATREPINIPARRKVRFTPLKVLKEAVL